MARWYARIRGTPSQLAQVCDEARQFGSELRDGTQVLEVAPGPGYFAIELARTGRVRVTGLDISRTFVQLAQENARTQGVPAVFREGDAASMPFDDESFDWVVSQAAFKNFSRPVAALDEMHRVLREGGTAVIQDMRREASSADIRDEVRKMGLGPLNAWMTSRTLHGLRRRAYTTIQFQDLVRQSRFGTSSLSLQGIGMEIRMRKSGPFSSVGRSSSS